MGTNTHVVIFSSGNQYSTILQLSRKLESSKCKCTLWTDLFTRQNEDNKFALLPTLLKKIPTFDFAIILATPDESISRTRNGITETFQGMRDNVIFEIGLCTMALGCNRTIILQHKKVHLFDDLIGVSGITQNESLLSASALGVKCFTYSSIAQLHLLHKDIIEYINYESQVFSPVVIGAACSTATGYFNMFIKRIITCLSDLEIAQNYKKEVDILVPYYIGNHIFHDIKDFYDKYGFEKATQPMNSGRDISFYYKIKENRFIVCDIPTSIGASYQMARDILSIDAADIIDTDSENRFLEKEANMFFLTLKKLLIKETLGNDIEIIISRLNENSY